MEHHPHPKVTFVRLRPLRPVKQFPVLLIRNHHIILGRVVIRVHVRRGRLILITNITIAIVAHHLQIRITNVTLPHTMLVIGYNGAAHAQLPA